MKEYLNILKQIRDNGFDKPDRTGTGRRSIFGVQMRFDLSQGELPVVTTRSIPTDKFIKELLWFISADTDNKNLNEQDVKIWNKWAVKEKDIEDFYEKHIRSKAREQFIKQFEDNKEKVDVNKLTEALTEHKNMFMKNVGDKYIGLIGPMYGFLWRNAPGTYHNPFNLHREYEDIPSDKLEFYQEEFLKTQNPNSLLGADPEFREFALANYLSSIDQLNELVVNLKKDPYSSRLIVTALIPQFFSIPGFLPQENVLIDRGCLYPCHMLFQCFVSPAKEEGGKLRLSLKMTQRSSDFPIGVPYNLAQYGLLLHLLAHVTNMEPYEFIWESGDTHIYLPHKETVDEQLLREPYPSPKVWLNPEVKDLFKFTVDDIKILDYKCHPKLKYEVFM